MFNELEIYLFSFFLDNTGWDYNVLIPEATYLPEFIINVEVQDFQEYQALCLYAILVAYATKRKMNEDTLIYECYFKSQIQNFQ
jgi:hypothetical protein